MSALRGLLLVTLPLLSILGYYGTFYALRTNGTASLLSAIVDSGASAKVPGTEFPLLRNYTHIGPLDNVLAFLVTFFAPVVDGSLDGYTRWGLGQFGAAWTVIVMEGLRNGNKGRLVSWTGAFGLAIQCFSYTVVTPIYLFIHLLTSPIANTPQNEESLQVESKHLVAIPYTIALGYILPSVAMALEPTSVSPANHQRLIAFWQFFPLLTTVVHYLIVSVVPSQAQKKSSDTTFAKRKYLGQTKTIHTLLLILCTSTNLHSVTSAIVHGNLVKRFLPHALIHGPHSKVPTLAIGIKNFLQWDIYIGCLALLLWSALLYHEMRQHKMISNNTAVIAREQIWSFILTALMAGPMGIVIWLLGERDKLAFGVTGDRRINKRT